MSHEVTFQLGNRVNTQILSNLRALEMLGFLIRPAQPILCNYTQQGSGWCLGVWLRDSLSHFTSIFSGADGLFLLCLAFIDFCLFYDLAIVYF